MNISRWFEQFVADVRFGLRNLAKAPSFSAIAIGSLALGIGGSTAMYSVIYAVILDPFPYKDPDRLMSVTVQGQRGGNGSYYPIDQFLEISERNTVFSRRGRLHVERCHVDGAGRAAAPARQSLHHEHVRRDGRGAADRPEHHRVRRSGGRRAGDAAGVQVLAAAVRRRPRRARPQAAPQRQDAHGDRRDAAALHVARRRRVPAGRVPSRADRGRREARSTCLARLKPGRDAGAGRGGFAADLRGPGTHATRSNFPKQWKLRLRTFGETFPSDIQDALWILFGAVGCCC